jgi:prolyl-tRNA editing enzyme YbaK/EbsC (Cys-tRNA(Pro) deacylase)
MAGGHERFLAAAKAAGVPVEACRFPAGTATAQAAADALGCRVAQIVKSLVFMADGRPFVALTSGANRADTAKLAAALKTDEIRRATPEEAREATGYAIGGTPPFGHRFPLPILMDADLMDHAEVWAAAGTPDSVFPISPSALGNAADARVLDFKVAPRD